MSFINSSLDPKSQHTKYATVSTHDIVLTPDSRQSLRQVEWGVNWKAPVKMVGLLIAGAGIALGHHFYYHYLDKKEVSTDDSKWNLKSQQWELRYGNAFAFLAKTCLAASISVAYQQHIWTTMRRKSIAISGLDATFGATKDLFSFLNTSFLFNVKVGVALAALTWLMALIAVVTPATLTVIPSSTITPQALNVPMVDYTNVSSLFFLDDSNLGVDANTVDNGISPLLSRLMAATASTLDILPMVAIPPAANYSLHFYAPSLSCPSAPANITTVINQVANYTSAILGNRTISFLAFTPQDEMRIDSGINYNLYESFVNSCIGATSSVDGSQFYCNGMVEAWLDDSGSSPYIWVKSDADYYSCELKDTSFNITFNATGNIQTINHPYDFQITGLPLKNGYYVHGQVLSNWLSGVVWGMFEGMASTRTRLLQTSLYAALKTNGQIESNASGIAEAAIPAAEKALTRGLTMGQLIEELSRNLTLSYFSSDRTWLPGGINTTVNIGRTPNIYKYNSTNLAWAYGMAIAATVISVVIGMRALVVNGISHGTSFSSIMCSTRNETLDNLTIGSSLAAEPLGKEVEETELKFGLLNGRGENHGLIRRVGFGVAGEVETLRKGASCY
ncbi:hypothetical protein G7Y89_g2260 [Cudoniella acicularis]|uniref:Uncharacterized protein n=1 Tax=Cudoniella acicularis TaxID=354080 RepID=A0A8H4RVI0_9HELO|nr:hypothetical protein G7Y89_g2260 [Cudoniella acicularis]